MRISNSGAFCLFLTFAFVGSISAEERKLELRLTAAEIWQRSHANNLRLLPDGKAIELTRGLLVENDGDAAGFSYKPNEEVLGEGIGAGTLLRVKLPPPRVFVSHGRNGPLLPPQAFLLVGHAGKQLSATINRKAVELAEPKKAGNYWKQFAIPPEVLKDGENDVLLSGDGKIWIARRDDRVASAEEKKPKPPRSYQRNKQGASLESAKLGPKQDIDGEYYIRLYLDGYLQGSESFEPQLRIPLLDAANLSGREIPSGSVKVKRISIALDGDWPEESALTIAVMERGRVNDAYLSTMSIGEPILNLIEKNLPRFFDVEIGIPAFDPSKSSRLRGIQITTVVDEEPASSSTKIAAQSTHSAATPFQSFEYEALDHPRLAKFRKQYNLDEVVKDCTTDLQRMEKLAVWSSQQWTKGHLGKIYPKWDALEILKKHEDGTPIGGFCQQYNIVFLQACQSFGMVGRCVSIGSGDHGVNIRSGHEVAEIWSNELNKWVYVDGQAAWYFVDKETRTPLNLLELRERQLAALLDKPLRAESKRPVDVVVLAKSPYEWKGLQEWPAFAELRMIPHTQFLDGKLPLPLNQGMRGWFWTGHRVWTDDAYPASVLYSDRVTNVNDWNGPINQTQLWLEQQAKAGKLDVRLSHNMPSFERYLVQIDDEPAREADNSLFTWSLHKGENRLQVRAVNKLGIAGPASWVKVEYKP